MGLLQRIQRALASGSQPVMWGTAAVVTGIYVVSVTAHSGWERAAVRSVCPCPFISLTLCPSALLCAAAVCGPRARVCRYDVTRVVKSRVKEPAPETAFDKTDVEQWNQFVLFQEKQKKEAEAAKAAAANKQ